MYGKTNVPRECFCAIGQVYNMISVRGDAVVIEYDRPAMDAALASDPRKSQVAGGI